MILFTDENMFTVDTPKIAENDRIYTHQAINQEERRHDKTLDILVTDANGVKVKSYHSSYNE